MADINVKQLSKAIKIELDNLLAQMKAAGLSHKSEKDIVSTEDKKVLLKFIKDSKRILTTAEVNLVLVDKKNFSIIRKRPDFISKAFLKLNG